MNNNSAAVAISQAGSSCTEEVRRKISPRILPERARKTDQGE